MINPSLTRCYIVLHHSAVPWITIHCAIQYTDCCVLINVRSKLASRHVACSYACAVLYCFAMLRRILMSPSAMHYIALQNVVLCNFAVNIHDIGLSYIIFFDMYKHLI